MLFQTSKFRKPLLLLLLSLSLMTPPSASADLGKMGDWAVTLAKRVPGDLGIAISTYLEIVRPHQYKKGELGEANVGIKQYFQEQMEANVCFTKNVRDFYADPVFYSAPKAPAVRMHTRLADLNVNGRSLEAGWLWKKALQSANGNPNLALKIIAFCGHDDIDQSADPKLIGCPADASALYYAEGLGPGIDTSAPLKQLIAQAQKIHIDPRNIKAKMYHVYGAAHIACQVIQKGVSPSSTADYSQKFAYIYRRLRSCENSRLIYETMEPIEDLYQKARRLHVRSQAVGPGPSFEAFVDEAHSKGLLEKLNNAFGLWFVGWDATHRPPNPDKFFRRITSIYYASKVYAKTTGCPDGRSGQFGEVLSAGAAKLTSLHRGSLFLPDDFDQRCESELRGNCAVAKQVLETWDADFKWTMEQHRLGAEFAAKVCKPAKELAAYPAPAACQ